MGGAGGAVLEAGPGSGSREQVLEAGPGLRRLTPLSKVAEGWLWGAGSVGKLPRSLWGFPRAWR